MDLIGLLVVWGFSRYAHIWAASMAYWHAMEHYFRCWLMEARGPVDVRKITNSPEAETVIREFIARMMDSPVSQKIVQILVLTIEVSIPQS